MFCGGFYAFNHVYRNNDVKTIEAFECICLPKISNTVYVAVTAQFYRGFLCNKNIEVTVRANGLYLVQNENMFFS